MFNEVNIEETIEKEEKEVKELIQLLQFTEEQINKGEKVNEAYMVMEKTTDFDAKVIITQLLFFVDTQYKDILYVYKEKRFIRELKDCLQADGICIKDKGAFYSTYYFKYDNKYSTFSNKYNYMEMYKSEIPDYIKEAFEKAEASRMYKKIPDYIKKAFEKAEASRM